MRAAVGYDPGVDPPCATVGFAPPLLLATAAAATPTTTTIAAPVVTTSAPAEPPAPAEAPPEVPAELPVADTSSAARATEEKANSRINPTARFFMNFSPQNCAHSAYLTLKSRYGWLPTPFHMPVGLA